MGATGLVLSSITTSPLLLAHQHVVDPDTHVMGEVIKIDMGDFRGHGGVWKSISCTRGATMMSGMLKTWCLADPPRLPSELD